MNWPVYSLQSVTLRLSAAATVTGGPPAATGAVELEGDPMLDTTPAATPSTTRAPTRTAGREKENPFGLLDMNSDPKILN